MHGNELRISRPLARAVQVLVSASVDGELERKAETHRNELARRLRSAFRCDAELMEARFDEKSQVSTESDPSASVEAEPVLRPAHRSAAVVF